MSQLVKKITPPSKAVSRRGLLSAAAGAVAATAAGGARRASAQQAATISLKMQTGFPPKEPFHLIALDWAKKVEEMAGGRVKIDMLPGGAVVGPFQVIEAVHAGTLDGGVGVPAYWFGKQVAFSLFGTGPSFGLDAWGCLAVSTTAAAKRSTTSWSRRS